MHLSSKSVHHCYEWHVPLDKMSGKVDNMTILEVIPMLSFREALPGDAGLISGIYAASWKAAYRGLLPQHALDRLPEDYWVPAIRSWLLIGQFAGLIAYDDDRPVGCAIFGRGRDESHADWGEIVAMYLLPEDCRKGYGTRLMQETLAALRTEGFHRFYLWCLAGADAAAAFYLRMNFKPTSDHNFFPIGGETAREIRYVLIDR